MLSLLVLLLAERSLLIRAPAGDTAGEVPRVVAAMVALLLPLDLAALSWLPERGLWGAGGFPVWFTAVAALLGVAAMALTMGLPDELHLYRPVFHLDTAWLVLAAVLFLSGNVALV